MEKEKREMDFISHLSAIPPQLEYRALLLTIFSPLRDSLGFVNQNSIRNMELTQNYTYYPKNKEGLIQQLNVNLGSEFTFNYNHLRKYFDIFSNTSIQWKGGNFRTNSNLKHIVNEEFAGFVGRNLTEISTWNSYNPSESIRLGVFLSFSESIRYDEDDPAVGDSFFVGTFNNFQITLKKHDSIKSPVFSIAIEN